MEVSNLIYLRSLLAAHQGCNQIQVSTSILAGLIAETENAESKAITRQHEADHFRVCLEKLSEWLLEANIGDKFVRAEFIAGMAAEIRANAHKGDWSAWQPSADEIAEEIRYHAKKLYAVLLAQDTPLVRELSRDLANLCMKAEEIHGKEFFEPSRPSTAVTDFFRRVSASTFRSEAPNAYLHAEGMTLAEADLRRTTCKHGFPGNICATCRFDRIKAQGKTDETTRIVAPGESLDTLPDRSEPREVTTCIHSTRIDAVCQDCPIAARTLSDGRTLVSGSLNAQYYPNAMFHFGPMPDGTVATSDSPPPLVRCPHGVEYAENTYCPVCDTAHAESFDALSEAHRPKPRD